MPPKQHQARLPSIRFLLDVEKVLVLLTQDQRRCAFQHRVPRWRRNQIQSRARPLRSLYQGNFNIRQDLDQHRSVCCLLADRNLPYLHWSPARPP